MSTKHTPGPWSICGANGGKCVCRGISQENGASIAHWYGDDSGSIEGVTICCPSVDEGLANARLIAAAPDLLAACEAVLENADKVLAGLPVNHEAAQFIIGLRVQARAAIAKAGAA